MIFLQKTKIRETATEIQLLYDSVVIAVFKKSNGTLTIGTADATPTGAVYATLQYCDTLNIPHGSSGSGVLNVTGNSVFDGEIAVNDGDIAGQATLGAAGTATITTSKVHTASKIFLTCDATGGTPLTGIMSITTITNNTSFIITSSAGIADTGAKINWFIMNVF